MKRTWHEDIDRCPRCKKDSLAIIAFITEITVVLKILRHLKLPSDQPVLAPARYMETFEQVDFAADEDDPAQHVAELRNPEASSSEMFSSRGPPYS